VRTNRRTALTFRNSVQHPIESLEPRLVLSTPTLTLDGGDTFATATNLGRTAGALVVQNALSPSESSDFYSFSVRSKGNVNLTLSGLSANANLRLFNASGKLLNNAARKGTRSESVSRTLDAGLYTIAIDRGRDAADTAYSLTLQADLNYSRVSIDGQAYTVALTRADGASAPIEPDRETWVVIHGWQGAPDSVHRLATAVDAASRYNQVLELDWSSIAADPNVTTVALNVSQVAAYAATQLSAWGIPNLNINLIGHSFGGYMTDEIARRIAGGVNRIVALDPASPEVAGIDISNTEFASHSRASVAFLGSDYASPVAAKTADETIRLDVGRWSTFAAHGNVRDVFTLMTERNNTSGADPISRLFSLTAITQSPGHRFANNGQGDGFDALLTGRQSKGAWLPGTFTYKSPRLGKNQTITA
jgi:pimeloyl-ACP methyl ester carboxylesterase